MNRIYATWLWINEQTSTRYPSLQDTRAHILSLGTVAFYILAWATTMVAIRSVRAVPDTRAVFPLAMIVACAFASWWLIQRGVHYRLLPISRGWSRAHWIWLDMAGIALVLLTPCVCQHLCMMRLKSLAPNVDREIGELLRYDRPRDRYLSYGRHTNHDDEPIEGLDAKVSELLEEYRERIVSDLRDDDVVMATFLDEIEIPDLAETIKDQRSMGRSDLEIFRTLRERPEFEIQNIPMEITLKWVDYVLNNYLHFSMHSYPIPEDKEHRRILATYAPQRELGETISKPDLSAALQNMLRLRPSEYSDSIYLNALFTLFALGIGMACVLYIAALPAIRVSGGLGGIGWLTCCVLVFASFLILVGDDLSSPYAWVCGAVLMIISLVLGFVGSILRRRAALLTRSTLACCLFLVPLSPWLVAAVVGDHGFKEIAIPLGTGLLVSLGLLSPLAQWVFNRLHAAPE